MSDTSDITLQEEENENKPVNYSGDDIKTLDWKEHIRLRPGMYIGKLGDGSQNDDGIYVLLKEVLDNAIDEYMMGFGKQVDVTVTDATVSVRDYGRGIPLDKLIDVSSKMNTGAKYDSKAFKKSVGLNGVGIKAVNALSTDFIITSARDGQARTIEYSCGNVINDSGIVASDEPSGTLVRFTPDNSIFRDYHYHEEYIVQLVKNYTFLNTGLSIYLNGKRYYSRNGLLDLLRENLTTEPLYPIIHLKGDDIEAVITHTKQFGEEYYSFVNGQHTTQGGTHLTAFRESVSRTIKEYFGKNFEYSDIRGGMVAAISIKVEEPVFESQTKTKLGSRDMGPNGPTVAKFIGDFIKKELDNYLHIDLTTADILLKKIQENERERKAMAGVTKAVREKAKKFAIHNKKLLDCRTHLCDVKGDEDKKLASSIFITEGDSAAGSITKIRDVDTQAVFSLRGKPLNTYGMPLVDVYKNDEFALLRAALNIEESIDDLRYNKVIIATDADVDGMHIRLLLLTYFLQFFPDLIKKGHVYVLQTPLFRVRNGKTTRRIGKKAAKGATDETYYCYNDEERIEAINKLGANAEITRFKGLGEISPEEFRGFIGPDIRLDRVTLRKEDAVAELLEFYMGKNTVERQNFIIDNLVIEDDSQIS
ncbi:type IIA DNA topoisomerase subunit B [Barnesiella sp. WM24]|uniref:DNA topoisomerase IV subunit B n=1 Tax=Barnesiella sp. WM24 TaxID=2558278 RepID=UPI00107295FD|nr:DNA topoisomerase IV subunit B [Barnesiella sp. WM24]TFU94765.1 type IIA DNA topoisomerase subunit B [Barnesiella sp. WM24]